MEESLRRKKMSKYVSVGKILNFHGIKGEAKIGYSKAQKDFLSSLDCVYVCSNNEYKLLKITSLKFNNKFAIMKFEGIDTINDIDAYKNCMIYTEEHTIRENLQEDEFLIHELVGMDITADGEKLGVVVGVSNNGATDLLSVKTLSKKIALVPFVKAIVTNVDIKAKTVTINNIAGLLE